MGIWIALEDATIDNGCLWFIPGSNLGEVLFVYQYSREIKQHLARSNRRRIRNPNEQEYNEGNVLIFTGQEEQHDDNAFVPAEVKAGRIVAYDYIVDLAHKIVFQGMPFSLMVMSCTRVHKV